MLFVDVYIEQDLLRFPVSLLTAAAVIEGVLEVLGKRYKAAGVDGRGKRLSKRDPGSFKKAALKCSRGVRLDIQEVLQIPDVSRPRVRLRGPVVPAGTDLSAEGFACVPEVAGAGKIEGTPMSHGEQVGFVAYCDLA